MPRFTPEFLDELKSRLRPSDVIGRYVKLKKQGNEYAGLSPFTKEKTPSFFVNDQKAFYHCFSSGKSGDVIKFLQETQNLSFHEAVERLAEEAGLELPRDNPREAEQAKVRAGLAEACEAAAAFFEATLRRNQGQGAADYLDRRGVSPEQIDVFRIGYAPGERTALKDYLINKGFTEETLVEAGLVIKPEDDGPGYDRFRNRIMFPITGARDRVIAFGGRALDPNARAKYLNSPETPLFHKGGVLYNLGPARASATSDKAGVIVCEGYMDVIALWGAGVKRAVAPLGTALTEQQLALLWRVSDEPVLCFDGDRAGLGAAYRAIDRALPLLKPGKSLMFAFLPEGLDPDDLVRANGAAAFHRILEDADPLADVLWRREAEAQPLDTPERRAALRAHLRTLVKSIADPDVRRAYGGYLADRLETEFQPARAGAASAGMGARGYGQAGGGGRPQWASRGQPGKRGAFRPVARASADLKRRGALSSWVREATLVLAALRHPALLDRQEAAFLDLALENPDLERVLGTIMGAVFAEPGLDREGLQSHLQNSQDAKTVERIESDETLNKQSFLRLDAEIDEVEWGWSDALRRHLVATNARREVSETASQIFTEDGEDVWKATVTARDALLNARADDRGGADTDGASSGDLSERLERMRQSVAGRKKH
ncbi:MAG: DNA primase [Pseudomonadota bacterium]